MKKPNLKLKSPKLDFKPKFDVKAPKFIGDLYGDLRDRRLLPLIALLVVAILAVPFLLKVDDQEKPLPSVAAAAPGAGAPAAASFSVVPAEPGLRPAKRLRHRNARDPFRPSDRALRGIAAKAVERAPPVNPSAVDGSASAPSGGSASTPVAPTPTPATTKVVVESDLTEWVVDMRAGFVDQTQKDLPSVPAMTALPNEKRPVVTFVGLSDDRKAAIFLMSTEVSAYYGGGKCQGPETTCQLLELEPGKGATFAVGFGETRYKVFLKQIVAQVSTHTENAGTVKTPNGE